MKILAIDPGPVESAYVLLDGSYRPDTFGKVTNDGLVELIFGDGWEFDLVVIEMVASYGMAVGAEVFETCVWIGRYQQMMIDHTNAAVELVKRLPVKLHHCHSAKAKDSNVTQALVDRFAPGAPNHGKGTKADPGWFYGFSRDVWAAYALAVYAADGGR